MPPEMMAAAPYDLVVGSDCTYSVSGHGALCDSILAILSLSREKRHAEARDGSGGKEGCCGGGGRDGEASDNDGDGDGDGGGGVTTRVILGHQHRTFAAALAGRGSAGWGRDPNLGMFIETAARRGLIVTELLTESLAWHGLRNVTVLQVELMKKEKAS